MTECDRYIEMISLMVDGELDESQKTQLLDHLSECAECSRVMSAFAFLSLSMREDEEAPESLKADVMAAVRRQSAPDASDVIIGMEEVKRAAEKKRARLWARFGALAACVALVAAAAANGGAPKAETAMMRGCADTASANYGVTESEVVEDEELTAGGAAECDEFFVEEGVETAGAPDTGVVTGTREEPGQVKAPSPQTSVPQGLPTATLPPTPEWTEESTANGVLTGARPENSMMVGSAANNMMSMAGVTGTELLIFSEMTDTSEVVRAVVTKYGGEDVEALCEYTDADRIAGLFELLSYASECTGEELPVDGDYSVMFLTDTGDYRLTLWISGSTVYCLDEYEGLYYVCECTAEQLLAFIEDAQP